MPLVSNNVILTVTMFSQHFKLQAGLVVFRNFHKRENGYSQK